MTDVDKVIQHFQDAIEASGNNNKWRFVRLDIIEDTIALLKEQEAVEPILEQDSMVCGVCGHGVIWQKMLADGIWADEALNYCPHCGRPVKWNG